MRANPLIAGRLYLVIDCDNVQNSQKIEASNGAHAIAIYIQKFILGV